MKLKLLPLICALLTAYGISANAQVSENEDAARTWITSHAKELKIKDGHTFKLNFVKKGLSGETLRFQQMVNETPVFDSEIVIHFSPKKEITSTSDTYDATVANIATTPSISKEKAIADSNAALNVTGEISFQECKLFVYNKLSETKLVYRVVTASEFITGSWEVIVDAKNGQILSKKDIAFYHDDHSKDKKKDKKKGKTESKQKAAAPFGTGTGSIFNPDPLSVAQVAYGGVYADNNDATNAQFDAARSTVSLPEIELASGVYKLKSTYAEIKNLSAPNKGLFTQASPDFIFNRSEDGFEAVNAFYHIDNSLRYINETLGIVCVPLNHSGVLWFDPSGDNGADNSHYSNGELHFGEGGVDDAEDADVILHELGHGLHDWMTNGSLSQVNGLSEGCGDYWAMSYSRSLNQWPSTAAAYNYVFSWDGHNPFWDGRVTNYPNSYAGGLTGQIHTDGQIWATSMMKIWDVIGKEKTDKIFLEGLALTTSSTNQQNAARAVRQAAIDMNYSCADIKTITEKFASSGYNMPVLPLRVNCPETQTVDADASGNYNVADFSSLSNAISANCNAVITQIPAIGAVLTPGTYTIEMSAVTETPAATSACIFTLVVNESLGIKDNAKQNSIVIFPNPASNEITIKGNLQDEKGIVIYNILGQTAMEHTINSNETKVDVSKLPAGVYTVYFKNSKVSQKFVKN